MSEVLLSAHTVTKSYPMAGKRLEVLKGVSLNIYKGEAICIVGSSGAGKSTLLHIMGTLDRPTLGKVYHKGVDLSRFNDEELAKFRNDSLGFVFQFHHLLSEFSALENVMIPCRISGMSKKDAELAASKYLDLLGLAPRMHHFPSELSGGEQQRVSIARALVRGPEVLMADEPTGNLDTANGEMIRNLFFELKQQLNLTLVVVTHDRDFAKAFPVVRTLKDGQWDESSASHSHLQV